MQIISKQLGQLEYNNDQVIEFDEGLLGFEELRRYLLVNLQETLPFEWLVSLDEPMVSFPVIDPAIPMKDYRAEVTQTMLKSGASGLSDKYSIYCIVNFADNVPTLNLRGPVIINEQKRTGKQVVLNDEKFSFRHELGDSSLKEENA